MREFDLGLVNTKRKILLTFSSESRAKHVRMFGRNLSNCRGGTAFTGALSRGRWVMLKALHRLRDPLAFVFSRDHLDWSLTHFKNGSSMILFWFKENNQRAFRMCPQAIPFFVFSLFLKPMNNYFRLLWWRPENILMRAHGLIFSDTCELSLRFAAHHKLYSNENEFSWWKIARLRRDQTFRADGDHLGEICFISTPFAKSSSWWRKKTMRRWLRVCQELFLIELAAILIGKFVISRSFSDIYLVENLFIFQESFFKSIQHSIKYRERLNLPIEIAVIWDKHFPLHFPISKH